MVKFIGFTIIFLAYFMIDFLVKRKQQKRQYGVPESVKINYQELKVPSDKIEVLTNQYTEEVETEMPMDYKVADALYDNDRNFTRATKYASVLVYHYLYRGKIIRLNSETIDMSNGELKAIINSKRSISIYYDKKDISNHYFDLPFLTE